jgi:hypothetical protein
MRLPLLQVFIVMLGVVMLAACGGGEDDNGGGSGQSLAVTLPPLSDRNIQAGCSEVQLDAWVDNVYLSVVEFADTADAFSRRASEERRDEIAIAWEGFIRQRELVNSYPTPECLDSIHLGIVTTMQNVISDFQAFSNAEIDAATLRNVVNPDIRTMEDLIEELEREFARLYAEV